MKIGLLRVAGTAFAFALTVAVATAAEESRVSGTVTDASTGAPVSGVSIAGRDGSGSEIHAMTDAKGRFTAIGLARGNISLAVAHPGYASEQVTCHVPSGESATFDIHVAKRHSDAVAESHCRLEPNTQDRYIIE